MLIQKLPNAMSLAENKNKRILWSSLMHLKDFHLEYAFYLLFIILVSILGSLLMLSWIIDELKTNKMWYVWPAKCLIKNSYFHFTENRS